MLQQEEISKNNRPTPYDLTDQSSGSDSDNQIGPISRYIAKYRKFSEQYTGLLKLLSELSESQLSFSELHTGQAAMRDKCTRSILEAVQLLQTCVPRYVFFLKKDFIRKSTKTTLLTKYLHVCTSHHQLHMQTLYILQNELI